MTHATRSINLENNITESCILYNSIYRKYLNRKIHTNRMKTSGCQGWRQRGWGVSGNKYRAYFGRQLKYFGHSCDDWMDNSEHIVKTNTLCWKG